MAQWALTLFVLLVFAQAQEALSSSVGQAAVLDAKWETGEEQAWPGLQERHTGLFLTVNQATDIVVLLTGRIIESFTKHFSSHLANV